MMQSGAAFRPGRLVGLARARDLAALERKIESHLQVSFGFEIDFSNVPFERALKTRSTFRNFSTLRRLLDILS